MGRTEQSAVVVVRLLRKIEESFSLPGRVCRPAAFVKEVYKIMAPPNAIRAQAILYFEIAVHKLKTTGKPVLAENMHWTPREAERCLKKPNLGRFLFIATVMVAQKLFEDEHKDNIFWADKHGIQVKELNSCERLLVVLLGPGTLLKGLLSLEEEVSKKWFVPYRPHPYRTDADSSS